MALRNHVQRLAAPFALLLLLAFGLAACGGDDDASASGDDAESAAKATATPSGVKGTGSPQSALGKKLNDAEIPEAMADGRRLGAADAKVVVEAYEDFGCPHCLDFTANIEPRILQDYVATGKIAFEYKYFPLRQVTAVAALAAECASMQDKFWPYHRALFIAQAEAGEKTGPPLAEAFGAASLKKMAAEIGLDTAAFDTCLVSDAAVDAVQADLKKANDLVLPGTPSFVINGQVTPAPEDYAGWKKLLDGLLK